MLLKTYKCWLQSYSGSRVDEDNINATSATDAAEEYASSILDEHEDSEVVYVQDPDGTPPRKFRVTAYAANFDYEVREE